MPLFSVAKINGAKARNDSESIVREGKGRNTGTLLPPNVSDDYIKNFLGIDDSQVKEIRIISKARKQPNIDGKMSDQEKEEDDLNTLTFTD